MIFCSLQATDLRFVEKGVIRLKGAGKELRIEAECAALYRLGLGVREVEVELVVLVVGAEEPSVCWSCRRPDGCRTGRGAAVGTGRPCVEAEED